MKRVLVATHGHLADGVKSLLDILGNNQIAIDYVNAYVDEVDFKDQVEAFFKQDANTYILLSDLYGGSVNQYLTSYLNYPNTFLISGFNIPLILEILYAETPLTAQEIQKLIESAKSQMKLVTLESLKPEEDDFF